MDSVRNRHNNYDVYNMSTSNLASVAIKPKNQLRNSLLHKVIKGADIGETFGLGIGFSPAFAIASPILAAKIPYKNAKEQLNKIASYTMGSVIGICATPFMLTGGILGGVYGAGKSGIKGIGNRLGLRTPQYHDRMEDIKAFRPTIYNGANQLHGLIPDMTAAYDRFHNAIIS